MGILILLVVMYGLAIVIVNSWHKMRMKITGVTSMSVNMDKRFKEYFTVFIVLSCLALLALFL